MPLDRAQLLHMSQAELDALFERSPPGPIPDGEAQGTALIGSGTVFGPEIAELINVFAWKGKAFDAAHGTLTNHVLPFGLKAIVAHVYAGTSWLDDKPCIVLDYSKTSTLAHWIRDEIRLVDPGVYLGVVYWSKARLFHFALEFAP